MSAQWSEAMTGVGEKPGTLENLQALYGLSSRYSILALRQAP